MPWTQSLALKLLYAKCMPPHPQKNRCNVGQQSLCIFLIGWWKSDTVHSISGVVLALSFIFLFSVLIMASLFFSFSFFCCPVACGVPMPGIRSKLSCELSHSCGNARFLTHCARLGIEPKSQHSQVAPDPVAPQQES